MSFKNSVALILAFLTFYSPAAFSKKYTPVEWDIPAPRFSELGMDVHNVASIAGDGQLMIARPGVDIKMWSKGEVRDFKNARFQSSAIVIDRPLEEVRAFIKDPVRMESGMPQVKDSEIFDKQGKHTMVSFVQVFKLPLITLKSKFITQWTELEDGSLAMMLHKGDVDTAVSLWEFYKLDEDSTLVVLTNWVDLDSAGLAFKIVLNAQPDLKPTIPGIASAMLLQQVKDGLYGTTEETAPENVAGLPRNPKIPTINSSPEDIATIKKLVRHGTVIKVHPVQWTQDDGEAKKNWFMTASALVDAPLAPTKKYAQQLTRVGEYFDQTRKVEFDPHNEGFEFFWKMKFNIGPVFVPVEADVAGRYADPEKNIVLLTRKGGSLDPLNGAFEWIPVDDNHTIISFALANQIGDDASWLLRFMRDLPVVDMVTSVFFTMAMIEKQQVWIPEQLRKDSSVAANQ